MAYCTTKCLYKFLVVIMGIGCFVTCDQPPFNIDSEGKGVSRRLIFDIGIKLMAPGTKWCGPGNIATDINDLGGNADVDRCCRGHDICLPHILAGESKFGLINNSSYTKLHCDCDDKFLQCLKAIKGDNILMAAGMRLVYVLANAKCFRESAKCESNDDTKCLEHSLETTGPTTMQWFNLSLMH